MGAAKTSDGSLLNLAAQLAASASDLQKITSSRGRSADATMLKALGHVRAATAELSSAVVALAQPIADEEPDLPPEG